jgi:hypothetical protein
MNEDKSLDNLVKDVVDLRNIPKWIEPFRKKYYSTMQLPFLLVYRASGVAGREGSSLYESKSGSIAVATKALQKEHLLGEGTNTLTCTGEIREIATMKRLGKAKTESYIEFFESL